MADTVTVTNRDGEDIEYTLGGMGRDCGSGRNPRCCKESRKITKGAAFCVCEFRSYCPDHGTQCNGTHS